MLLIVALIAAWGELYPPDNFPMLWQKLGELIAARRLFAPTEVVEELGKKGDGELLQWARAQAGFDQPRL